MPIAKEGLREMLVATLVLGAAGGICGWLFWPLAIPFAIVWLWVISFFRDPRRTRTYRAGDLCSPADGTVTEIAELDRHDLIDGPAVRIGIFLSLFNVHVNRSPCSGVVRTINYKKGEYLDARHPESGVRNESNTLLIDTDAGMPGPIVVRQVAGLVAQRIICHATIGSRLAIGERFGLIKFGSRTELIIPRTTNTEILVGLGDKVSGGLTILARQSEPSERDATADSTARQDADVQSRIGPRRAEPLQAQGER